MNMKTKQPESPQPAAQSPVMAAPAREDQISLREAMELAEQSEPPPITGWTFHGKIKLLRGMCWELHQNRQGGDWYLPATFVAELLGVKWEEVARWLIEFRELGFIVMTQEADREKHLARRYRYVVPIRMTKRHAYVWSRELSSGNVAHFAARILNESEATSRSNFSRPPTRADVREARQWCPWGEIGFGFELRKVWQMPKQLTPKTSAEK